MTGLWVSPGTPNSSTNKTDCHDITEILLKVVLNTISQTKPTISLNRYNEKNLIKLKITLLWQNISLHIKAPYTK
jgi:hypothetical protein